MKQVRQRTVFVFVIVALFLLGLGIFCIRYLSQGRAWATFAANDSAYTGGILSAGQITDRSGTVLYDGSSQSYNENEGIREATLHAVGDEAGSISTSALSQFQDRLIGYNLLTGTTGGGHRVQLTLDAQLNQVAYDALDGRKGTVGIYNYKTGEILCMVSAPAFDPADPPEIEDGDERYDGVYMNRFLSSTFTPGSVFKTVTAAAALENLPDLLERTFVCTGSSQIGADTITCPYVHGTMDFYEAMASSCNCTFAQLAVELGSETLQRYAQSAGLLSSQSISGIETATGTYDVSDTASNVGWSGVGQYDDLVNPCALMTMMGAIAGGDTARQPYLLQQETNLSGSHVYATGTSSSISLWTESTCRTLQKILRNNVTSNYGQSQFGDLAVCAKSGTAEVGTGSAPHSWFAGFVADEELPLAFVVLVENGGGGASVAGRIAARVLNEAAELY